MSGPRFALLAHSHPVPGYPTPHFDLLLEDPALDGEHRCRTWRLRADPRFDAPTPAAPLPAHRVFYLDHEGPVSGGRGTVRRLDGGSLNWESHGTVTLAGQFLTGRWAVRDGGFGPVNS